MNTCPECAHVCKMKLTPAQEAAPVMLAALIAIRDLQTDANAVFKLAEMAVIKAGAYR